MKDILLTDKQRQALKLIKYDMSDSLLSISPLRIGGNAIMFNNGPTTYSYPVYTFSELIEDFPDTITKDGIVFHFELTKKADGYYRIMYIHDENVLFGSVQKKLIDCAYDTIVWLITNDYLDIEERDKKHLLPKE